MNEIEKRLIEFAIDILTEMNAEIDDYKGEHQQGTVWLETESGTIAITGIEVLEEDEEDHIGSGDKPTGNE